MRQCVFSVLVVRTVSCHRRVIESQRRKANWVLLQKPLRLIMLLWCTNTIVWKHEFLNRLAESYSRSHWSKLLKLGAKISSKGESFTIRTEALCSILIYGATLCSFSFNVLFMIIKGSRNHYCPYLAVKLIIGHVSNYIVMIWFLMHTRKIVTLKELVIFIDSAQALCLLWSLILKHQALYRKRMLVIVMSNDNSGSDLFFT